MWIGISPFLIFFVYEICGQQNPSVCYCPD
jgi:hypothetical protein